MISTRLNVLKISLSCPSPCSYIRLMIVLRVGKVFGEFSSTKSLRSFLAPLHSLPMSLKTPTDC